MNTSHAAIVAVLQDGVTDPAVRAEIAALVKRSLVAPVLTNKEQTDHA